MRKKKLKSTLLVATTCLMMASTCLADYTNWTEYETSYVEAGVATTSDNYSVRYTDDDAFGVYVLDQTMWSNPKVRLVNSEGASRSSWLTLKKTGKYYYGTDNTSVDNYKYYLSIKPAWNQVGKDSMTYKFSAR